MAVIGGGITGLAAAHRLVELDPNVRVTLFEANDRLGGVLQTVQRNDFLIERSADGFITNVPWAIDLCRRIGFDDQLVGTTEKMRGAFVVRRGRLRPLPEGFLLMAPSRAWPIVFSPLLSVAGKLRMACELFVSPKRDEADESLASFVRRRLGREAYDRIVQPLIGGIYTSDPEKLSVAATMPQFVAMERKYGSLIRGARTRAKSSGQADKRSSGARYSMFVTPRGGMTTLVDAIASRLPEGTARLNSPVKKVTQKGDGWEIQLDDASEPEAFAAVIMAAKAAQAAPMLAEVDEALAADLSKLPTAGTAVVAICYNRKDIRHALDGFGFVVPIIENRRILAGSFSSIKYPGRAPEGQILIRVFVGGACQPELALLPDDELRTLVHEELSGLLGIQGEPLDHEISRWSGHIPQYHVGHLDWVKRVRARAAKLSNFTLAGNAYDGVGVPMCIHSGEKAAAEILGIERPAPKEAR